MKKWLLLLIVSAMLFLLPSLSMATAGSCTQTLTRISSDVYKLSLVCTGDSTDGSLPTVTLHSYYTTTLLGYYLYQVVAYPTSGGTAPDAADVTVNMAGQDLLGGKGVNLIHATATYDTLPYSTFMSSYRFPAIISTLTVGVANQATLSANFTIDLIFAR